MTISFTPGPWFVVEGSNGAAYTITPREGDAYLGVGYVSRYGEPHLAETHKANASLIAAAPELVDGINALLGLIQLVCGRDDMPKDIRDALETSHRLHEARAALAKAGA